MAVPLSLNQNGQSDLHVVAELKPHGRILKICVVHNSKNYIVYVYSKLALFELFILHVFVDKSSASFLSQHHAHCLPWSLDLFSFTAVPLSLSLSLNQDGMSALHVAAKKGSVEVVKVLVDAKANLDLVDKVGGWVG